MSKKSPHPVDVHVGKVLREKRSLAGMSQTDLGEAAGITFQQVQKYERGSNRISASMMWKFGRALKIPASTFFEGLSDGSKRGKTEEPIVDREVLTLARHFKTLKSPAHRAAVCSLARSLAA